MMDHGPNGEARRIGRSPPVHDIVTAIETTVTHLEMRAAPLHHVSPPVNMKLMLMRAERPEVAFYRYLYDAVGRSYHWVDRKQLGDEQLAAIIHDARVEIWIAYVAGQPAGYFEVDVRSAPDQVELVYLGLIPAFHGLGLGKWLLSEALRVCWAQEPARVTVQTCTLDGPAALPLYQKMGFVPYARETRTLTLEARPPRS